MYLSPEMDEVLDEMCCERDLDKEKVLKRAVLIMEYLDEQMAEEG